MRGATTITTANPTDNQRFPAPYPIEGGLGYPPPRPKISIIDSPIWGPFIRRFFPHIVFGALALGIIIGILAW